MTTVLRVAAFEPRSEVNGPGVRAVVWLQGCDRVPPCPGCYNPELLDMAGPAESVPVSTIAERILELDGIDGVTFSGGEPFAQSAPLAELARALRAHGLTVVVFSGRTLDEIRGAGDAGADALLAATDLLVDGPYRRDLPSNDPLRSSANQRLHFLTGRIGRASLDDRGNDAVEITLSPDGEIRATGLVDASLLRRLRSLGR